LQQWLCWSSPCPIKKWSWFPFSLIWVHLWLACTNKMQWKWHVSVVSLGFRRCCRHWDVP
jgi:hypothetical protein